MAGTSHRGGQTSLPCGWQSSGSRLSLWPYRSSETRGATRGPQPAVPDLLQDPTHYRPRLQRYSCSRRSPKWAGRRRPWLGAAPELISPIWPTRDGADGPAFYVEGPHLPIAPRLVLVFNRDTGTFPIRRGDLTPTPLIRSHPLLWSLQIGMEKPSNLKLDCSWLRDAAVKASIEEWLGSQIVFSLASERVPQKLADHRLHLLSQRRQIWADRTRARDTSLARIKALDVMEDSRPLTAVEACERKKCREGVAEADLKFEMDLQQQSRQLWLAAGDANTKFFHQAANGRTLTGRSVINGQHSSNSLRVPSS